MEMPGHFCNASWSANNPYSSAATTCFSVDVHGGLVPVLLLLLVANKVSNRLQLPYVESFLFFIFFY